MTHTREYLFIKVFKILTERFIESRKRQVYIVKYFTFQRFLVLKMLRENYQEEIFFFYVPRNSLPVLGT